MQSAAKTHRHQRNVGIILTHSNILAITPPDNPCLSQTCDVPSHTTLYAPLAAKGNKDPYNIVSRSVQHASSHMKREKKRLKPIFTAPLAQTNPNLGGGGGGGGENSKYTKIYIAPVQSTCSDHSLANEKRKTTRAAIADARLCCTVAILTSLSKTMPKWRLLTVASENCMKSAPSSMAGCLRPPTQPRSVTRKDLSFQSESVGPKHYKHRTTGARHGQTEKRRWTRILYRYKYNGNRETRVFKYYLIIQGIEYHNAAAAVVSRRCNFRVRN